MSEPRPALSWMGTPVSRPPIVPRPILPVPTKTSGSSWLDPPKAVPAPPPAALSDEPDPMPEPEAEEGAPEPGETPDFPRDRVHDNPPYRAAADAVPPVVGGAIIVHPNAVPVPAGEPSGDWIDEAMAAFAAASTSAATRRAYLSGLRDFAAWCVGDGVDALPATSRTVSRYLTHLAGLGRTVSTIDQRAAAIAFAHRRAGLDAPTGAEEVRTVLAGIRNTVGRRPTKKKALTADLVAQVVKKIPADLVGLRDRAMILLAFGAALRRSELVGLDVGQIETHRKGLLVRLGKTKTDQTGEGRTVAVLGGKLKAPEAVATWIEASGIEDGPLFRGCDRGRLAPERLSAGQFARVLKARCEAVGLDPELFSGHSPRRGFATTAGDLGADLRRTANHMRHERLETTMGYMEDGNLFRENAGRGFM